MQSSIENQGEIRKPSLAINAKIYRKTTEWERLEISSRKLDTKGTFHAKMGTIKDRTGSDLTEAEAIKRRWQEYTAYICKKDLHDPENQDGLITHLEPDILECKAKRALGSITKNKASGDDRIPAELFQILKMRL